MNQCDGCRVNAPLTKQGNHAMPDGGFMGCTKNKYDSPVAMPTVSVDDKRPIHYSDSYIQGYQAGYYYGKTYDDNPYPYSEGVYDLEKWDRGCATGRNDLREGKAPQFSQENEGSKQ